MALVNIGQLIEVLCHIIHHRSVDILPDNLKGYIGLLKVLEHLPEAVTRRCARVPNTWYVGEVVNTTIVNDCRHRAKTCKIIHKLCARLFTSF